MMHRQTVAKTSKSSEMQQNKSDLYQLFQYRLK